MFSQNTLTGLAISTKTQAYDLIQIHFMCKQWRRREGRDLHQNTYREFKECLIHLPFTIYLAAVPYIYIYIYIYMQLMPEVLINARLKTAAVSKHLLVLAWRHNSADISWSSTSNGVLPRPYHAALSSGGGDPCFGNLTWQAQAVARLSGDCCLACFSCWWWYPGRVVCSRSDAWWHSAILNWTHESDEMIIMMSSHVFRIDIMRRSLDQHIVSTVCACVISHHVQDACIHAVGCAPT
jgi:hypothetical protein